MMHQDTVEQIAQLIRDKSKDQKYSRLYRRFAKETADELVEMANKPAKAIYAVEIDPVQITDNEAISVADKDLPPTHYSVYVRYSDFIAECIKDFESYEKAKKFAKELKADIVKRGSLFCRGLDKIEHTSF